jgi:hypothetical protein
MRCSRLVRASAALLALLPLASGCGDDADDGLPGRDSIAVEELILRTADAQGQYTFSIRMAAAPSSRIRRITFDVRTPSGDAQTDFDGITSVQVRANGEPVPGTFFTETLADVQPPVRGPVRVTVEDGVFLDLAPADLDEDGIANEVDNCATSMNADQGDFDEDSVGDLCDPDPQTPIELDARGAFGIGMLEFDLEWIVSVDTNLLPEEGVLLVTTLQGDDLISDQAND